MLHYSDTGKLKSPEISISKGCFALLITADQAFSAFLNEKISVYIERAKGGNTEILTNIPLAEVAPVSMHGVSAIIEKSGVTKILLVLSPGSIRLNENENIKVVLDGLKSTIRYTVNSVESPFVVDEVYKYERKTITTDETVKSFDVPGFRLCLLSGFDKLQEIYVTYSNGVATKYMPEELHALANFSDPIAIMKEGVAQDQPTNAVLIELEDVISLEIQKNTLGAINLCLVR